MAAWQADFHVVVEPIGLPSDYRARLAQVLPETRSLGQDIAVWGSEAGDRVDVSSFDSGPQEVFARFDLRELRPDLYERFLAFVRGIGGRLVAASDGADVPLTLEAFIQSLQTSSAAQFVRDPEAYLRALNANPIRMREEP